MAKIWDNAFSSHARQLMKLRLSRKWLQDELDALPGQLTEKHTASLQRYAAKLNKRLEKPAFAACDKALYADSILADKLQRYDRKDYLRRRAIQHRCAKDIFARIRDGKAWDDVLATQRQQFAAVQDKRDRYVARLMSQKQAFLTKHPTSDSAGYDALHQQCLTEYEQVAQARGTALENTILRRSQKLEKKIAAIDAKIARLEATTNSHIQLPDDVLLRVQNLKMYFGGLKAVDDLTFDVKKGEIFGLIGPNGAGKTTVFNCITRFYDATGGDMYFVNKDGLTVDLRHFQVHDVILQGITRTFQNVELVKEVSVLDNLLIACTRQYRSGIAVHALGLPQLRHEDEMLRRKAMDILAFMGLENYAQWLAFGLPYGILKKVEIARALIAGASLIIMDEPAAGLNDSETAELTQLIRRIRDEFHVTILLVEHDMGLVMNVCDTVCAISFGKMLAIGTRDEIKNNRAVQEAYLGVEEDA